MLFSLLSNSALNFGEKLLYILVILFCVLISLSIHELSHGLMAFWMGDRTARQSGRLSLNPLHHLDPVGALCLFLFGFGWAKPVPVNPWNFNNKKGGMVLTAFAGPLSNFIFAFVAQIGVVALSQMRFTSDTSFAFMLANVCYIILIYLAQLNLGLALFNLIPIPPLDGSKILNALLPQRLYFKIMEYERFGFILLILLINAPFFNSLLYGLKSSVLEFYTNIIELFIH